VTDSPAKIGSEMVKVGYLPVLRSFLNRNVAFQALQAAGLA